MRPVVILIVLSLFLVGCSSPDPRITQTTLDMGQATLERDLSRLEGVFGDPITLVYKGEGVVLSRMQFLEWTQGQWQNESLEKYLIHITGVQQYGPTGFVQTIEVVRGETGGQTVTTNRYRLEWNQGSWQIVYMEVEHDLTP